MWIIIMFFYCVHHCIIINIILLSYPRTCARIHPRCCSCATSIMSLELGVVVMAAVKKPLLKCVVFLGTVREHRNGTRQFHGEEIERERLHYESARY